MLLRVERLKSMVNHWGVITGVIWKQYDAQSAVLFSLVGMGVVFVVYLIMGEGNRIKR